MAKGDDEVLLESDAVVELPAELWTRFHAYVLPLPSRHPLLTACTTAGSKEL